MQGITLTDIQESSIKLLLERKKIIIADPTGSGKTIACLAAYEQCTMPNKHLFVITTKSAAPSWVRDVKYFPQFKIRSFSADDKEIAGNEDEQNTIELGHDITLVRASSIKLFSVLIRRIWFKNIVLVVEEAHTAKNPKSQVGSVVRSAVRFAKYSWLITATPILNHIEDVYNMVDILRPGALGKLQECMDRYTIREERKMRLKSAPQVYRKYLHKDFPNRKIYRGIGKGLFEWEVTSAGTRYYRILLEVVGHKNLDELATRIAPYYTRTVRDLDLEYNLVDVELSHEEEVKYKEVARGLISKYDEERIFSQRLPDLQLYVDNAIEFDINDIEDRTPNKSKTLSSKEKSFIDYLRKIVTEKPVLIYTPLRLTQERLARVIKENLGDMINNVLYINGGSDEKDRGKIADSHSVGDVVIITDAGGMSLNFDKTDEIIFYGLPFSIGNFIQTVGRITRQSSAFERFRVTVVSVSRTIDEYKYSLVKLFSSVVTKVLSGKSEALPDDTAITRQMVIDMRKDLLWRSQK